MSIGPLGMIGAAAGAPLAQQKGTDSDRVAQDQNTKARQEAAAKEAAKAEGVGETEQDHEAADRDADGRRVWERFGDKPPHDDAPAAEESAPAIPDASGERGNQFDATA